MSANNVLWAFKSRAFHCCFDSLKTAGLNKHCYDYIQWHSTKPALNILPVEWEKARSGLVLNLLTSQGWHFLWKAVSLMLTRVVLQALSLLFLSVSTYLCFNSFFSQICNFLNDPLCCALVLATSFQSYLHCTAHRYFITYGHNHAKTPDVKSNQTAVIYQVIHHHYKVFYCIICGLHC